MTKWDIIGVMLLLILLGLMPTLLRRKRLEIDVAEFVFALDLVFLVGVLFMRFR